METEIFDVIIIGGGPGGLEAALQLGRYRWKVMVVDRGKARASFVPRYNNILGFPKGVSGRDLLATGKKQAETYNVQFQEGKIATAVVKDDDGLFTVTLQDKKDLKDGIKENILKYQGRKIIFNTGVMDRHPEVPNAFFWAGHGIYYCPDCDGYEVSGRKVTVIGRGNAAAALALTLLNWTNKITIVISDPEWPMAPEWQEKIAPFGVKVITGRLKAFVGESKDIIEKVILMDGTEIETEKVFSALGKYSINSELAVALGVETTSEGQILADPRTKETNINGVWAVGDVVAYHPQQVTVAIGEGVQAAIWVNKRLRSEGLLPVDFS